jgi:hypothetical protein
MGSRVDIFRLETGQSYSIVKSSRDTDLLGYVHDDTGEGAGRTYILARHALFPQLKPDRVHTMQELRLYQPPYTTEAPRKWMVVANGDDAIPIGIGGPVLSIERKQVQDDILLVSAQRAVAGASRSDIVNKWTSTSVAVVVGLIIVLTLLIMIVGISGYNSRGGDTTAAPSGSALAAVVGCVRSGMQPLPADSTQFRDSEKALYARAVGLSAIADDLTDADIIESLSLAYGSQTSLTESPAEVMRRVICWQPSAPAPEVIDAQPTA